LWTTSALPGLMAVTVAQMNWLNARHLKTAADAVCV
jgi:hypothetical protein